MTDLRLRPVVERIVGMPVDRLSRVRREHLDYDPFLAGRSLERIRGLAHVQGDVRPWSLIEKVTEDPAVASAYLYDNGEREFRAYQSGLLADLPAGVRAPAAYGRESAANGRLTLWLEDLGARQAWSPEDCVLAARHLGRLAGRWLGQVPEHSWLFGGWIERHGQSPALAEGLRIVSSAAADQIVTSRLSGTILKAGVAIMERQAVYRSILQRLPVTLCHHDAVASNLFIKREGDASQTVLIDWETVGPGPVGADVASLLFSSVRRGDLAASWLAELKAAMLAAHIGGIAEMGAHVDEADVRLGYATAVCLRWTLFRDLAVALTSGRGIRRGSAPDEPPEVAMDELIALAGELSAASAEVDELAYDRTGVR